MNATPHESSRPRTRGSALIELAIAVCLCSLLGCGIAIPLAAQVELSRERATTQHMVEIRATLLGFALANGRLPCPADAALAPDHPRAGHTAPLINNECAGGYAGTVPWASLGTAGVDAWGRRYRYRVARDWADGIDDCAPPSSVTPAVDLASPSICLTAPKRDTSPATEYALEVRNRRRAGGFITATESVAAGIAFVLVSHGANGHFGSTADARIVSANPRTRHDESHNANAATLSFVARAHSDDRPGCADDRAGSTPCAFDDLVQWMSRAALARDLARAPWAH